MYARFRGNIWTADLAEIRSSSSLYQHAKYLLCVIDIFTKYPSVKPLKDKKSKRDEFFIRDLANIFTFD